jgi:hypothetical protein
MPFVVRGHVDDLMLMANGETAEEAFAKAVEWHVAKGFSAVSISDGHKRFTIAEFSWTMASQEIANTVHVYRQQGRQTLRQSKSRP